MQLPEDALLLRIFIGESDKQGHRPLYEVIVKRKGFDQMDGKPGFPAPGGLSQFVNPAHGNRVARPAADLLQASEQFPTVTIGQGQVAQEHVERFFVGDVQGRGRVSHDPRPVPEPLGKHA